MAATAVKAAKKKTQLIKDVVVALHNDKPSNDKEKAEKKKTLKAPKGGKLKGVQLPLLPDLLPVPEAVLKVINRCRCGKNVAMYSGLLSEGFCGDKCYEQAKASAKGLAEARVKVTAAGQAYFEHGDIRFDVDSKDLAKVVGSKSTKDAGPIARLMDSQVVSLAQLNGLPVSPFVRELLEPVLVGLIQLVWYRDLEKHDSDHLTTNQMARVANYLRRLSEYKAPPDPNAPAGRIARAGKGKSPGAPRATKTAASLTSTIELKKMPKEGELPKQAFVMLTIVKEKGGKLSVADLQSAMVGRVVTKQPMSLIWGFYRAQLMAKGLITVS